MSNKYRYVKFSVERRKEWINELKSKPCMDCGKTFPTYVMQFHHRDPETKKFSISHGVLRRSREQLLEEVAKCDLLCSNCHAIREHNEHRDNHSGYARSKETS